MHLAVHCKGVATKLSTSDVVNSYVVTSRCVSTCEYYYSSKHINTRRKQWYWRGTVRDWREQLRPWNRGLGYISCELTLLRNRIGHFNNSSIWNGICHFLLVCNLLGCHKTPNLYSIVKNLIAQSEHSYREIINSSPDCKHLLQENYVEYKYIFLPLLKLVSKISQQDGAPPHWDSHVRRFLDATFPNRWIGRDGPTPWPPRSPDITPLDSLFWGHVKDKVFSTPVPVIKIWRQE